MTQNEERNAVVDAAISESRRLVRRYVPEGVSLSDELIAERRAEARREDGGTK